MLDSLDAKCDALFRFAATIGGLTVAAANFLEGFMVFAVAPLVCWSVAVALTLLARRTIEKDVPMVIPHLFNLPANQEQVRGRIAAGLHCNIVANRCVLNWKSRLFDVATLCVVAGVLAFTVLLPLWCLFSAAEESSAAHSGAGRTAEGAVVAAVQDVRASA